jgi:hypothetical protein
VREQTEAWSATDGVPHQRVIGRAEGGMKHPARIMPFLQRPKGIINPRTKLEGTRKNTADDVDFESFVDP